MPHAIVTGGAGGIGLECAVQLGEAGYDVSVIDISPATQAQERLSALGREVEVYTLDVSDRAAVHEAVSTAAQRHGGIDAVVTAAGIWGEAMPLEDLDEAALDHVLGINLYGTVWTAQAAMPHLRRAAGRLVCIGSEAGRVGGRRVAVPYAASKGAIHALVRTWANQEIEHGVLVNGVAPGLTDTAMIAGRGYDASGRKIGRAAHPGEIASVAVFLCSPGASYMSGAVIDVNGGEHVS